MRQILVVLDVAGAVGAGGGIPHQLRVRLVEVIRIRLGKGASIELACRGELLDRDRNGIGGSVADRGTGPFAPESDAHFLAVVAVIRRDLSNRRARVLLRGEKLTECEKRFVVVDLG